MAFQIAPFGNDQFFDSNGVIASGFQLFTYLAHTTQKEAVFVDVNGAASHTNPIILNSIGMPPSPIFLSIAKRYKFVYASPTDTDPPASPLYTVDDVDVGFDTGGVPAVEWVVGTTPTYLSANSFSIAGDQRSTYQVGRRVQLLSAINTVFGTISQSVFGANTIVTVLIDSGSIDASLSAVYYGFLSASGSSWPDGFNTGLLTTFNGDLFVPPTANFNLLPVGMEADYAGSNLPPGYLWCNGQAVSRLTYPALFGAIGISFGAGDGVTTFNVPDRRGRFALGLDNMGGVTAGRVTIASTGGDQAIVLGGVGGEQVHVLTVPELPAHTHSNTKIGAAGSGASQSWSVAANNNSFNDSGSAGSSTGHNTMPNWIALNVIIRYA